MSSAVTGTVDEVQLRRCDASTSSSTVRRSDPATQPGQRCDSVRYVAYDAKIDPNDSIMSIAERLKVRWWWNRLFAAAGSCQPEACEAPSSLHHPR